MKTWRKLADLEISGAYDRINEIEELIGDENLQVVIAGKSAAFRIEVRSIEKFRAFEEQEQKVKEALRAASEFLELVKKLSSLGKQ